MSELEADFLRRTGKRLDQCTQHEIEAEIFKMRAEAARHRQHANELLDFDAARAVTGGELIEAIKGGRDGSYLLTTQPGDLLHGFMKELMEDDDAGVGGAA